ncbi:hypothetical protein ACFLTP_09290 [Chloroflexota bacterium]
MLNDRMGVWISAILGYSFILYVGDYCVILKRRNRKDYGSLKGKGSKARKLLYLWQRELGSGLRIRRPNIQKDVKQIKLKGPFLPCIPVTCTNCGNTHLLNLITLGLKDLVEKKEREKAKEKAE